MRAIRKTKNGGTEALEWAKLPDPVPGPGEVLVEIAAAGVNFMDIGVRQGVLPSIASSDVLGVEGAGRVLASGPGAGQFQPGQRVAWVYGLGSYAERIVVNAGALVPVPDAIDDHSAAAVMMQGLTASHFATDFYPIQPGDTALVLAAAGGLGLILTQIIKLRGGTVIGQVSSAAKVAASMAAGASHVIVDKEGEFADQVLKLTNGEGVHVVYDGSGPTTYQGSIKALRRSGTFCWFGPVLGGPGPIEVMSLPKSIKIGYAVFADHIHTPELLRSRTTQLFDWIISGDLKLLIGGVYPLADAAQAHTAMESRATTGKLLLIPDIYFTSRSSPK